MSATVNFIFASDQVVTFCSTFAKCDVNDQTQSLLVVKMEELDARWKKLASLYEVAMTTDDPASDSKFKESAKSKYAACSERYYSCKSQILDLLKILEQNSSSPKQNAGNSDHQSTSGFITVPPCDTETFFGGYESWPSFRDMFTAVYINHPKLTPAQKLYHLRNKTKGQAGNLVKQYQLCDENFSLAWDALKTRYENKQVLVDNQLKILFNITPASYESSEALQRIQSTINDCLSVLKSQDISIENWDPILVYLCSTKIPQETLILWQQSLKSRKTPSTWNEMNEFLTTRYEVVERVNCFKTNKTRPNPMTHNPPKQFQQQRVQSFHVENEPSTISYQCKACQQNHALRKCPKFRGFSVQERSAFVSRHKICSNCLAQSHTKAQCKSTFLCLYCKQPHHSLLHVNQRNENIGKNRNPIQRGRETVTQMVLTSRDDQSSPSQRQANLSTLPNISVEDVADDDLPSGSRVNAFMVQNKGSTILPTALVHIGHMGDLFTVRALIDQGSQRTFISQKIQSRLGLPTQKSLTTIGGMGGQVLATSNYTCTLELTTKTRDFSMKLTAIVLPKLTNFIPSTPYTTFDTDGILRIPLADPNFHLPAQIDMILGSDVIPSIIRDGIIPNFLGSLLAQNTVFGWFLSGPVQTPTQTVSSQDETASFNTQTASFHNCVSEVEEPTLSDQLRKFWEIEGTGEVKPMSVSDVYCEHLYKQTTFRQPDGRYVVKLPFKEDFSSKLSLGASRNGALQQYTRMESILSKNPTLKTQYDDVLNDYITLNHMSETNPQEISEGSSHRSYYLPHHAVLKPESTSTKVRVVFNASKRTKDGSSLNDVLYCGPTLQSDLMLTLLHWRKYRFAFNGDIQKMYRQILVHDEQRQYQRILFRPTPQSRIKDYTLNTVTFGVNCAPFLAIRTLHQLAEDCKESHPLASTILKHEIYVDDVLSGGHDLISAQEAQTQVITALASAGFPLKKFTANHLALLSNLPPEDRLASDFLEFENTSSTKTLGIKWNGFTDLFCYTIKCIPTTPTITKRQMLSAIASLFDPAGWLSPVMVQAKILLQLLWLEGLNWDDCVKPLTLVRWNAFVEGLPGIADIKVPRWLGYVPRNVVQIHGFCDSSEKAYCATVYIRNVTPAGKITCTLVVAKTKVAPLHTVSLPRLELCAALLLSELIKHTISALRLHYSSLVLWTDSTIVLAWLEKPPCSWKTFIANRTSQIFHNVENAVWRHVPTRENPADLGTRGCSSQELKANSLWWHGPCWLSQGEDNWPEHKQSTPNPPEEKKVEIFNIDISSEDILDNFSSYPKALRVVAYMMRFYNHCLPKHKRSPLQTGPLTADEISQVKTRLITMAQQTHYPREYKSLSDAQPVSKKSTLLTLNPFMDASRILRANGRLANSALSYKERHPIILPQNSRFCLLFVEFVHNILLHAENQLMLRSIRQEFYIPKLKNKIKKCIFQCKTCTISKQRLRTQIMAALPSDRVTFSLPFTVCGVDFAGPFQIKSSSLRRAPALKGYACVFVCFATKAIHLEAVSELTTEAFCAAFTRFVSRRGLPLKIFSDNGRNFVGANRALSKEFDLFLTQSSTDISDKYSTQGFQWHFIPPSAPHMGGLWEAAVKSFKTHFKKVASAQKFNFEEFSTLLTRIEAVLNSRPLSPIDDDPTQLLPLTPGHFLRGAPLTSFPEPNAENLSLTNRWRKLKVLHHQFSRRWKNEYLVELHKRYKWKHPDREVQRDDFVVIKDDQLPPSDWRLGRIIKTYPGLDGHARVADINTQSGVITRPIVKLCVLPIS